MKFLCFDSLTLDDNRICSCILEKDHSGEHYFVPDSCIKIQFGKDDVEGKLIILESLHKDKWL